jgi:hypothetical protein
MKYLLALTDLKGGRERERERERETGGRKRPGGSGKAWINLSA